MAKAPTSEIPPMVIKCLLMLSSDQDGEVVAASRAMKKALEKNGLSLHELADKLKGGGQPKVVYRDRVVYRDKIVVREKVVYRDRPQPEGPANLPPAPGYDPDLTAPVVSAICPSILKGLDLSEVEDGFVRQMFEKAMVTNRHFRMTAKQGAWFRRLAARAGVTIPSPS